MPTFPRSIALAATTLTLVSVVGCGQLGALTRAAGTTGKNMVASSRPEVLFAGNATEARAVIHYQTRQQLSQLAALGIDFHGFDHDTKRLATSLTRAQYDAALKTGVAITTDARRARNAFDTAYHTYDELAHELRNLAVGSNGIAELVDVGDAWEKTQGKANRDILALHITKKGARPDGKAKPVVLFAGCHHARELVTPEVVLNMATELVNGYGKDAELTAMVDTRDIWLVPMVNPDGHARAAEGEDQRKNTNTVTGGKRRIGVDLNRNYGAPKWSLVGSSNNPESDTFCGKTAFSEPEVQAMRDLMRKIKPVYLLTFHSYSNVVLWPWGYTDAPPPDARLALVGNQLGKLSGYKAGQSSTALYATAGDDTDFAFAELGTLAYTVEIGGWGDGFDPPFSSVAKFWKENRPMMMYTLRTADNPAAAAGPELVATATARGRLSSQPAVAAEYFVGQPGATGSGAAWMPGAAPSVTGGRQLVWSHGRDAKGVWGPWSITWSK